MYTKGNKRSSLMHFYCSLRCAAAAAARTERIHPVEQHHVTALTVESERQSS